MGAGWDVPWAENHMPGQVFASNLTPDPETGIGAIPDDAVARAIREGVSHDGRALFMMPWQNFKNLSDEDVAAVVAYLRTLAPVKKARGTTAIKPPVSWFLKLQPAPLTAPIAANVATEPVARGRQLAELGQCGSCHTPVDERHKRRVGAVAGALHVLPQPLLVRVHRRAFVARDIRIRLAGHGVETRGELGALGPGDDLDAVGRVDRGSLDRGEVEHHPRVPADLAEAPPVDPGETLGVVLCHRGLERDAASLLHPLCDPHVERGSKPRTAELRQHEHLAVAGSRFRVPADVGERGAGILAALRRDEPRHVLGLAFPVDVLGGAALPVGPHAAGDADPLLELVGVDLPDVDHDSNDTPTLGGAEVEE